MFEVKGYKIADELFTRGMRDGQGPCKCSAACCLGGVFVDVSERERILSHRETIVKYMDESQPLDISQWFEQEVHNDSDFPSGRCVGTAEYNSKCAFLDKENRCSLQVTSTAEGMGVWSLKPFFCVLYPVEITDKTIRFDDLLQGETPCCSVSGDFHVPLFEVCREELIHVLGYDGFEQMREHYRSLQEGTTNDE